MDLISSLNDWWCVSPKDNSWKTNGICVPWIKPENCNSECFLVCLCPYSDQNRDRGSFIGALGWLFSKTHGPASVDQVRPAPVSYFTRMFVQCSEISPRAAAVSVCRIWAEPTCGFVGPKAKSRKGCLPVWTWYAKFYILSVENK